MKSISLLVGFALALSGCRESSGTKNSSWPAPIDAPRLEAFSLPIANGPEISDVRVDASAKAPDGSLWFAMDRAIARFDPKSGSIEHHEIEPLIESLIVSRTGVVWIGTNKGLLRFDPQTRTTTILTEGLPGNDVDELLEDSEGRIWCAVRKEGATGGTVRLDPKTNTFELMSDEKGGIPLYVSSMFQSKDGAFWFDGTSYMFRIDLKTKAVEKFPAGIMDDAVLPGAVLAMHEDTDGALWFATYHGLTRRDPATQKFETYSEIGDEEIRAITGDGNGGLWLGTPKGLKHFDSKTKALTTWTRKDGLTDDKIRTLLTDGDGMIWIGTESGGLNRFDPKTKTFSPFVQRSDLGARYATAIGSGPGDSIWFGALNFQAPLYALDAKTGAWTAYTEKDGVARAFYAIFVDADGRHWAGGHRHDSQTNTFAHIFQDIDKAAKPAGKAFWYTSWSGVERADSSSGKVDIRYREDDGLAGRPDCIAVDTEGGVWVGTNQGANRIDRKSKTVATFTTKDGLPSNDVNAAHVDKLGNVWLGTNKGLARFDAKKGAFSAVAMPDISTTIDVSHIFEDAENNLWLAASVGDCAAMRFNPQTNATTLFGQPEGFRHCMTAFGQAPDGAIWLGWSYGAGRMVLADPDEAGLFVKTQAQSPRVAISGQTIALTRQTGLSLVEQTGDKLTLHALPAWPAGADITALAPGPREPYGSERR